MDQVLTTIRKYQNARGWTDYELSERAGMPQSTVSSWFGKQVIPTLSSLEKICTAFGITLSQFFAGQEEPVTLTASQRELLERWARLNDSQQRAVLQIIDTM